MKNSKKNKVFNYEDFKQLYPAYVPGRGEQESLKDVWNLGASSAQFWNTGMGWARAFFLPEIVDNFSQKWQNMNWGGGDVPFPQPSAGLSIL